jgi:hypothetical protein
MAKPRRAKPENGPLAEAARPDVQAEGLHSDGDRSRPLVENLDEEIHYYTRHLGEWAEHEGRHVLIHGQEPCGFFASREEALREGLRRFGRVPFLVKQVIRDERPRPLGTMIL